MGLDTKICFLNKHNTKSNQFKPHTHNCYEIVYFAAGTGRSVISGKSYPISPGAFCLIPPHTEHVEELEGFGEIHFIGFTCGSPALTLRAGSCYIDKLAGHSYFSDIFDEFQKQEAGFEESAEYLLRLFLLVLLRNENANPARCRDLNYIRAYIEQYADQKIDFRALAARSGYSYDYFRHIFKSKFGKSPQGYQIGIRLSTAKHLLETTNLSCTEVAYRCGFSNSAQMSMMFKEKLGVLPSKIADGYKK